LLSYYLFLRKETFFNGNRLFLISGLVIAIVLPFITITKTVLVAPTLLTQNDFYMIEEVVTSANITSSFNWASLLFTIYLLGVLFFTVKLLIQLSTIKKIKKTSDIIEDDNFYHVKTRKQISPFSFFKHIFYFPKQFEGEELHTIIEHEKVHARELHSIDILLTEILFIILWFNPIIWLYRIIIKQNLEFLADAKTCAVNQDKKNYQYLMLKQALGNHNISIANPFYNSITRLNVLGLFRPNGQVKKRIVMLNQNQSKKRNQLKLLLVLPALAIFLVAFNTKNVYKTAEVNSETKEAPRINKGFNYIITKNTTNDELKRIKQELKEQQVDFSYTAVRDSAGKIIDIQLNTKGKDDKKVDFNMSYDSNSEKPIKDLAVQYNEETQVFFIGKKSDKEKLLKKNSIDKYVNLLNKTEPTALNEIVSVQITEVKIEVDKDSKDDTFKSDSKFLAEKGVSVDFKGIKRNSNGEITAIKVVYDNGAGDKGTYQKKKNTPIEPFKVVVNFKNEDAPKITISQLLESKIEVVEIMDNGNSHNTWVSSGSKGKTIKIKKEGDTEVIYLNGKLVTREELGKEGKIEKWFVKGIDRLEGNDSLTGKTTIDELKFKDEHGNEEKIIRLKAKNNNESDFIIIKKDSSDSKFKKVVVDIDNNIDEHVDENVFVIKTDEAGDYDNNLKFVSKKGPKPLFIMDGKEVKKLKNTSPDEIESINVLKGKAARKKYGRKGKNGVVEIITKEKN
jgi:hypothetical protein